jgi:hypothetical protein
LNKNNQNGFIIEIKILIDRFELAAYFVLIGKLIGNDGFGAILYSIQFCFKKIVLIKTCKK